MHHLVETEVKIFGEKTYHDLLPKESAQLPSDEKDRIITNDILFTKVEFDRTHFLKDLCILASEKKLNKVVTAVNSILSDMLDASLRIESENKKWILTHTIVNAMKEAHFKSVDNGVNETTFTTGQLHQKIESIKDPKFVKETGKWITEQFCKMSLHSIEKGHYDEFLHLGLNGRILILHYPELANIIVDYLGKSLEIISEYEEDIKPIAADWAVKELRSLEHWDNHPHEEITKKVQKILQGFSKTT
jgi:hypothetical protein